MKVTKITQDQYLIEVSGLAPACDFSGLSISLSSDNADEPIGLTRGPDVTISGVFLRENEWPCAFCGEIVTVDPNVPWPHAKDRNGMDGPLCEACAVSQFPMPE